MLAVISRIKAVSQLTGQHCCISVQLMCCCVSICSGISGVSGTSICSADSKFSSGFHGIGGSRSSSILL